MYINVTPEELEKGGLDYIREKIAEYDRDQTGPRAQKYRDAVRTRDGELEVDDGAVISWGDDDGAYVMSWSWVATSDISGPCLTCGTETNDEGICPICAAYEEAQDKVPQDSAAENAALDASISSCRKCGTALALRDVVAGNACTDDGEGPEAGKVFVYCSGHCRATH